ncbi:DUF2771 domain-containing protein [Nocardia terpenica]|uniref:DUF2771 family protein n=1 Tax=Nocardia terpenica TaxID=455432 RepID=A0A291RDW2_9NOCA|nr:DUF2771 domain-containing protein [Nocardia terpenica]ATL65515.1 hypothetical protein CRH09_04125 [Nocardia terpenica]
MSRARVAVTASVAALLVFVVAVAAVVFVAVRNAHTPDPQITAYAHGKTVTVPPYRYCSVSQADNRLDLACRESDITVPLDVPVGYPVQLSLPRHLAGAPWVMILEYRTPQRKKVQRIGTYLDYKAGTMAVTVDSHPERDLRLAGIEMQLVVPARDESGNESFEPYQAWSIRTAG